MSVSTWLVSSDRLYRLLLEAATDYAICLLDTEGRIGLWNTGAEQIIGYTSAEIVNQDFAHFFPTEDRVAGKPQRILRTARKDGRFEEEGWRIRKDGSRFWAHSTVVPVYDEKLAFVGYGQITQDITERKATEEKLFESERRFRVLVESVTDYAIYMLDPDGQITSWNSGAERFKGYSAAEIIGQNFSRFYTPEDRAAGRPARALRIAREQGHFTDEGWRVRKDGSRFWALVVLDPIYGDNNTVVGYAKVTRDITERREAQKALDEAREQLFQSQKLEAIGQLTGGVAHDFNNLLMVILGSLELARPHVPDDSRLAQLHDSMRRAGLRAAELTGQLLAFARRQPLKTELINPSERLSLAVDLIRRSIRGDIDLRLDIDANLWPIEVDPAQLDLSLLNVAINSRDAMPDGGLLQIVAKNVECNQPDQKLVGKYLMIQLTDSGTGIPEHLLEKVIEPFYTTKEVGKGSGLGLSQAHGFAAQSGGALLLQSNVGRGTTVTLYLPASSKSLTAKDPDEDTSLHTYKGGNILVVEDNLEIAQLATALLSDAGYTVQHADSADTAFRLLEKNPEIDLVFTDIVMPGVTDGLSLAQQVRERFPRIAILLTSGYSDAGSKSREFPLLNKPYDAQTLRSEVARLISLKRAVSGRIVSLSQKRKRPA